MGKKNGKIVNCENCGKEIYRTLYRLNKNEHQFCSTKCQREYDKARLFEWRKCEICEGAYYVSKKSRQRFCSPKCQTEWQKTNIGHKNRKFKGATVNCDNCGKEIDVGEYRMKQHQSHFCSNECRQEWYSKVWSQSDDWKEESRIRAARLMANKKAETLTKPQRIVNDILDDLCISYENEKPFVYYAVDNYIEDYNLIIEVMGDYWHTSPLFYSTPKYKNQAKVIARDKAKRSYIKKYYGIDILNLWENDINNNQELCIELINEYIENNGKLDDYNSFNYDYKNGVLKLKSITKTPFFEIT